MCTTFVMRWICGHEYQRKVVKCVQAIRSQLGLAEADIMEDSGAIRSGCVCEIDLPEEHLKPDICEECKTKGLICDYLNNDPRVKFDILREWRAQKRAQRIRQAGLGPREDADSIEEPEFAATSSVSSVSNSDPRTPTSGSRSSYFHISEVGHAFDETGLTPLSPTSVCFTTTLIRDTTDFDDSEFETGNDEEPNHVLQHVQSLDGTHDLRCRATVLEEKLQHLIAENKRLRACEAKDWT